MRALAAFAARREPRVDWVRRSSAELGRVVGAPTTVRDEALRSRGAAAFRDAYLPLAAPA
jgi:hypothetical protein